MQVSVDNHYTVSRYSDHRNIPEIPQYIIFDQRLVLTADGNSRGTKYLISMLMAKASSLLQLDIWGNLKFQKHRTPYTADVLVVKFDNHPDIVLVLYAYNSLHELHARCQKRRAGKHLPYLMNESQPALIDGDKVKDEDGKLLPTPPPSQPVVHSHDRLLIVAANSPSATSRPKPLKYTRLVCYSSNPTLSFSFHGVATSPLCTIQPPHINGEPVEHVKYTVACGGVKHVVYCTNPNKIRQASLNDGASTSTASSSSSSSSSNSLPPLPNRPVQKTATVSPLNNGYHTTAFSSSSSSNVVGNSAVGRQSKKRASPTSPNTDRRTRNRLSVDVALADQANDAAILPTPSLSRTPSDEVSAIDTFESTYHSLSDDDAMSVSTASNVHENAGAIAATPRDSLDAFFNNLLDNKPAANMPFEHDGDMQSIASYDILSFSVAAQEPTHHNNLTVDPSFCPDSLLNFNSDIVSDDTNPISNVEALATNQVSPDSLPSHQPADYTPDPLDAFTADVNCATGSEQPYAWNTPNLHENMHSDRSLS